MNLTVAINTLRSAAELKDIQARELIAIEGRPDEKTDQLRRADELHAHAAQLREAVQILEKTRFPPEAP
jgi:hypothetical protein